MRGIVRQLLVAAATMATLAASTTPAHAALRVQAQWDMDQLPTMLDSAGKDNNGTTANITRSGGRYVFNGSSSLATVPDKSNLDPGTKDVRLTARISVTTTPQIGQTFDVVRKGVTTSEGGDYKIEIGRSPSGTAVPLCLFKDSNGLVGMVVGTTDLANRGLVTITCSKTSSRVTLDVNGQIKTASTRLGSISNSSPLYVGAKGDGTDWFPGEMAFVRVEIG
jgi:hypothetical protein